MKPWIVIRRDGWDLWIEEYDDERSAQDAFERYRIAIAIGSGEVTLAKTFNHTTAALERVRRSEDQ